MHPQRGDRSELYVVDLDYSLVTAHLSHLTFEILPVRLNNARAARTLLFCNATSSW